MHTLADALGNVFWGLTLGLAGTIFGFLYCSRRSK